MSQFAKLFFVLLFPFVLSSCFERDIPTGEEITENKVIGTWGIISKFPPATTDCEKDELIEFYADSTLLRSQCDTLDGTWAVVDGEIQLDLGVDPSDFGYDSTGFNCYFVDENVLKIESKKAPSLFWAKYEKLY